ncbi:AraC family transcriptional regulator [Luteibacter sp. dw_328]|uniref:AraC family transcriptional regulator n=1 Tax=Luteibacter sp. dw_328 TaxID=2719796 RepID=UPI001BD28431|nr:AraC family transcriptional regulator [Luteibacter sp. dw_328]
MVDPLTEVVTLLQPITRFSKQVLGGGSWRVSRSKPDDPFYCVVLQGGCRVTIDDDDPIELSSGDFILVPLSHAVGMTSLDPPPEGVESDPPVCMASGEFRIGAQDEPANVRMLVGHCSFASPDAALLVALLPRVIHVRGEHRLATLVQLVRDESREQRPAREAVLARLVELLLIEAFRLTTGTGASPGLVRGLADARLATAIRLMHERPSHPWTVSELAKEAALSRTTFFVRFSREVGVTPMDYLLAWRMALAKELLRQGQGRIAEIAERVGYGSASTFSVAFTRHVQLSPMQYVREHAHG